MAAKKSTKKQNKSASGRSTRQSAPARSQSRQPQQESVLHIYRREIWGAVCLVIALLIFFSSFDKSSAIAKLFMGLVGEVGLYVLPVGLVLCFITLMFHGGRPVTMRLICSLSFAFLVSAISHLVLQSEVEASGQSVVTWGAGTIKDLYLGGIDLKTGGVIGGLIAMIFSLLGGRVVAWALSILLLIVTLPASLNLTLTGLLRALNHRREQRRAEEEPKPYREPAEVLVDHVAQRHSAYVAHRNARNRFAYDLPVDEPPIEPEKSDKPRDKQRPISPDEYIAEGRARNRSRRAGSEPEGEGLNLVFDTGDSVQPLRPAKQTPQPEQATGAQEEALPQEPVPEPEAAAAIEKVKPAEARKSAAQVAKEISENQQQPQEEYVYPPVSLLHPGKKNSVDGTAEMRENTHRLQETLECFNVDAQIINVTRGPSVTMYELELAQGVRLNRLTGLADDIALSLGATGVRISAIPDKISVVGIEVPNKLVSTVSAREVIDSPAFRNAQSVLSFAVGKDISGNCIIGDIAKLPHMLIAGTTGSGKSVCMNSLITSLLYKAKPEEVRLIMVDPKMVELGVYNGIPHLLIPVVTDPKKAAGALQWTVTEMMRRYRMMSEAEVRDLESYNKMARGMDEMKPMERIVVVIDELADLMMVAAKEVEESICRIAQMGRAAGIHLVIATQRPSADVITGLMKANIPSRIAFAVSSAMESRIILDTMGAEKLVGKGDMLFAPLGKGKPRRVQGCFITEEEVQSVTEFVKKHSSTAYSEDIQQQIDLKAEQNGKSGGGGSQSGAASDSDGDELLPAAVEVILETGQASVSMLQRRLKLGYARAARIVDEMEERGIVGPFEGSKPRQLLVTKEQWQAMMSGQQMTMDEQMADNPPVEDEIP